MTEIFISYSRRDKEFVLRFLDALKSNGYNSDTIWVDWEDIPSSSKWENEIRKGIQETNSVIFILSPEWAKSNECAKELAVAAQYNKRLFPIVWQNVDPNTIQKELASLNWIFFRESDNFDEGMQKLLAALKTDLDWVSQHTNLTRQALAWDNKGRDAEYLLRGKELQEAEAWLAHAEDKQPRPSTLQNEFIYASRQDEVERQRIEFERQRRNLIRVRAALVVAIVLAVAAVVSWLTALRQSQRALASQLSAESISLLDSQPDLALLLSMEANHIGDELNETDPAWLGSLLTALNSSPKLNTYLRAHDSDVRAVAFSPDGHWLITAGGVPSGETGEVYLWELSADTIQTQKLNTGDTSRFLAAAFSADGRTAVTAGDGMSLFVWDVEACCDPIHVINTGQRIRAVKFVEVGGAEYLAAATGSEITFWDLGSESKQDDLTIQIDSVNPEARFLSLAFSLATGDLAAGSDDGNVVVWNLGTGEKKFQFCSYGAVVLFGKAPCDDVQDVNVKEIRGLEYNADGTLLVAGSSDNHAWLWDAGTGEFLAKTPDRNEGGHISTVTGVAFNLVTEQIATVSWDNTVRLWDLDRAGNNWEFHRVDTLAGHSNSIWAVAYSPDGEWLVSASSDKTVILWSVNQINQIGAPVEQMNGLVWALAVASDGEQFAAGDTEGNIQVWNFDGEYLTDVATLKHPDSVFALAYSHDDQWLASAGSDGVIRVWNTQTWAEAWRIENAHDDEIWSLMFSPDDQMLASASFDKTAKLWNTTTHQQIGVLPHDNEMFALTFNEDASKLLVAGYDDLIHQWDVTNPAAPVELAPLKGHIYTVNSLSYNLKFPPLLVSTSDDKTVLIWNVDANQSAPPVLGLNESMEAVTFRPSGDWIASATNNDTVLLWQLGDPLKCSSQWNKDDCKPSRFGSPLVGHRAPVNNVLFLTDSDMISSSEDGQLILWDLDKSHWYESACDIVTRELDDAEYNQYISGKAKPMFLKILAWFSGRSANTPSCIHQ